MPNKKLEHIFAVLCCCGLVAHVLVISGQYFAFETSTKVIIDTDCPIRAPTLSFCVRYMDLIPSPVLSAFNITVNQNTSVFDKYFSQSGKLLVSDIFQQTPSGEDIIDNCMIRKANSYRTVLRSSKGSESCFRLFNITKYYMQSFVCYRFLPASVTEFPMHELAHSYNYEYSIYAIRVKEELAHADSVLLILNYGPYPYLSRSFGALRKTRFTDNSETRPNEYFVQTKVTDISLQPPPYDTRCDPDFDQASRSECIIRGMQGLSRVPNTEIVPRPYDWPHVVFNDEHNQTFKEMADEVYQSCNQKYGQKYRCEYTIASTDLRMRAEGGRDSSSSSRSLRIRVMSPGSANTHVISEPAFPLSDYLLYVSSCFGIWLGVSINRFNPVTWGTQVLFLMRMRKAKRRIYQQQEVRVRGAETSAETQREAAAVTGKEIDCYRLPPVLETSHQQMTFKARTAKAQAATTAGSDRH